MEEKKKSMKIEKGGEEKQEKLTYEQLNDACQQLFQQNQQLVKQLREANLENMFRRLDYLFEVVRLSGTIKDADFVNGCIDEIKEAIVIKDNKEEEK